MSQDPEASRAFGLAHGQVCYLQLPAADRNRAAAFYRAVFGWQTETHHPDFESLAWAKVGDRARAREVIGSLFLHQPETTHEWIDTLTGEAHHPDFEAPGLIGQWVEGRPPARDAGPVIWLAVADMNETLDQVTRYGGQILEPPAPDGPTRILATIADPEGNPIGLAAHAPGA